MSKVIFMSGIDTDAGKTFATGYFARQLMNDGVRVITQKMAQTGCEHISSDIVQHRKLMDIDLTPFDTDGTTCPYIFRFAASPHLAAKIEGRSIDTVQIDAATDLLCHHYDVVLLEGAGGLFVPITEQLFTIDFIRSHNYPLVLVSSARLGSINHTLLSLEACKNRGIRLEGVFYNLYPRTDELIANDSRRVIQNYCAQQFPNAWFIDLPILE